MSEAGTRADTDVLSVMRSGEIRVLGLLPRASNFTFLAEATLGTRSLHVVYKPREGETPLWDFPEGTLCQREVAAYLLAEALGWPNVPPTVLRDGPMGEGSVQRFVVHDPRHHYFTLRDRDPDAFRAVAAFDAIAGNGDRKSGHCLAGDDARLWVVDHGLCFNADPILRTVIWDFADEPVPPALHADVARVAADLERGSLRGSLLGFLSAEEIDATAGRARRLVSEGRFPLPGPGRSHPWPAI